MTQTAGTKKRDYAFMLRIAGVIVAGLGAFLLLPSFMSGKSGVALTWGMLIVGAILIGVSYVLAAKRPAGD
jgi:hypothetical protein